MVQLFGAWVVGLSICRLQVQSSFTRQWCCNFYLGMPFNFHYFYNTLLWHCLAGTHTTTPGITTRTRPDHQAAAPTSCKSRCLDYCKFIHFVAMLPCRPYVFCVIWFSRFSPYLLSVERFNGGLMSHIHQPLRLKVICKQHSAFRKVVDCCI